MTTHTRAGKHCRTSKPLHALRHRGHDCSGGAHGAVRDHRRGRDENVDGHYVEGYGEGGKD